MLSPVVVVAAAVAAAAAAVFVCPTALASESSVYSKTATAKNELCNTQKTILQMHGLRQRT